MIINVDCDGVLVPNIHEESLFWRIKNHGYSFADCSQIWDWYSKLVETVELPVNELFLRYLNSLKEQGHSIRLWTNRMYTLKNATLKNLGDWTRIFDSFEFHQGRKGHTQVEGVVIDNSKQYLSCGQVGVHYEWRY